MRVVFFACIFAIVLFQHKTANNSVGGRNQQNSDSKQANKPISDERTSNASDQKIATDVENNQDRKVDVVSVPKVNVKNEKDVLDWLILLCTVILTVVGIVGTRVAIRTLNEIKRQADTLDEHKRKFEELAAAAKNNAQAAQKGAETAAQNIELYISKERARLGVELKPLVFPAQPDYSHSVDFTVSIHGPTDAFITESLCAAYYFPPQVIDQPDLADLSMFPIHPLPSVITANSSPVDCYAFLGFGNAAYNVIVDEIKAKNFIVGIRGFIKYKDVFGRERETAFRYVWQYTDVMYGLGEQYGGWIQQNPEENRET